MLAPRTVWISVGPGSYLVLRNFFRPPALAQKGVRFLMSKATVLSGFLDRLVPDFESMARQTGVCQTSISNHPTPAAYAEGTHTAIEVTAIDAH